MKIIGHTVRRPKNKSGWKMITRSDRRCYKFTKNHNKKFKNGTLWIWQLIDGNKDALPTRIIYGNIHKRIENFPNV